MRFVMVLLGAGACINNPLNDLPAPRDCETRQAFYPDEDGDGLGEPTTVVIACEAPDGFATELGPTEPLPTGDTGA